MLLTDIIENPSDDGVRLIYADWLDENGQSERAEFIRAQVWPENSRRARELIYRWCQDWVAPMDGRQITGTATAKDIAGLNVYFGKAFWLTFRRGFMAEVNCTLDEWQIHGPALSKAHPIQKVTLTDREPSHVRPPTAGLLLAGFFWWRHGFEPGRAPRSAIPDGIISAMSDRKPPFCMRYDTADEATDALSSAAILWARSADATP